MSTGGLSTGCLQALTNGAPAQYPIFLQCMDVKIQQGKNQAQDPNKKRFRLHVNDGATIGTVMLASQVCEKVMANELQVEKGTILRVDELLCNDVQSKRVLILLQVTAVGFVPETIGNPVHGDAAPMGSNGGSAGAAGAPPGAGGTMQQPGAPIQDQNVPPQGPDSNQQPYNQHATAKPDASAPPPAGMPYGQPPMAGNGNQFNQYPPAGAGPGPQYGGPPQAAGAGPGPTYGGPPPAMANSRPMYGGPQGGPPGGPMYGGPPGAQAQGGFGGPGGATPYGSRPPLGGGGGGPQGGPGGPNSFLNRQPPAQYNMGGSGPVARNEAPARIVTIRSLNPYSGRWAIKARCTAKTDMRRWNGVKGEGKLFSFDLLDADGGEIRCTAFNDQAEKFIGKVDVGGIYMVAKASLQHKKPQFNNTPHDFEIQLGRESVVERCDEDDDTRRIPRAQFNFVPIGELEMKDTNSIVDVLGVVEQVNEAAVITRKTGEETRKRSLVIRDSSNRSIEVTLWGSHVDEPGGSLETALRNGARPVLGAKALRVGDFNGKTLSTLNSSTLIVDPDGQEAQQLRFWYQNGGAQAPVQALTNQSGGGGGGRSDRYSTLSAIKDENLGKEGKPDWISVGATITFIRNENGVIYPACSNPFNGRMCQKKMQEIGTGMWSCERCSRQTSEPLWRYLLSITMADHTSSTWVSVFGEQGESIFGMTAPQYREAEQSDPTFYDKHVQDFNYKHLNFRLKVAEDTWNDEARTKVTIFKVEEVSPAKDGWRILDLINKMEMGVPVLQARGPEAPHGHAVAGGGGGYYAGVHAGGPPQQVGWNGGGGGGGHGGPPQYQGGGGGGGNWVGQQAMTTPPRGPPQQGGGQWQQQQWNSNQAQGPPPNWNGGSSFQGGPQQQGGWNSGPPQQGGGGGGGNWAAGPQGGPPQQGGGGWAPGPQQQGGGFQQAQGGPGAPGAYNQQAGWQGGPPAQQQGGYHNGPPPQQQPPPQAAATNMGAPMW